MPRRAIIQEKASFEETIPSLPNGNLIETKYVAQPVGLEKGSIRYCLQYFTNISNDVKRRQL